MELLNEREEFQPFGQWIRQDPGFPDAIFVGSVDPVPGFEIKAWFPLATEITARFKDSQNHFVSKNTWVALLAWLPEFIIYGRPKIIGVCIVEGGSIARARDTHYHNPPDYLVMEPEDTSRRTSNLQQSNTNGYKWQGTTKQFEEAQEIVKSWGGEGHVYKPTPEYQARLRRLFGRYNYRLDTNYAKMDRIVHPEIESFKRMVTDLPVHGLTVKQWARICRGKREERMLHAFEHYLEIREEDADKLLQ